MGYALSPIDLIPDFIPVLGFVDDAILLPLLIWLSLKLISKDVITICRESAENAFSKGKPKNYIAGGIIVLMWLFIIAYIIKRFVN